MIKISAELQRELMLFKSIAEHSHAVIGAKDLDGRYLYVNSEYSRLFHLPVEAFLGHTDAEVFPSEIAANFRQADLQAQRSSAAIRVEEQAPVDGVMRHYLSVKFPIRDEQGVLYATGLVATDITDIKRLTQEFELQASTDALTGLLNRRRLFELGEQEVLRAQRFSSPLTVVMFDLDHFKAINDQYGHALGDEVLCGFADLVSAELRSQDSFGRVGGEEFVALLLFADVERAHRWAQRVRQLWQGWRPASLPSDLSFSATVSGGVAQLSASGDSFEALLNRADQGLYLAKSEGRNRICDWRSV